MDWTQSLWDNEHPTAEVESRLCRSLYVTNLLLGASVERAMSTATRRDFETDLLDAIDRFFAPAARPRICKVQHDYYQTRMALVAFDVPEQAHAAVSELHRALLHSQPISVNSFGRRLLANWPTDTETAMLEGVSVVLASHLHPATTAAQLCRLFSTVGDVLELQLTEPFVACEAKLTYDRQQDAELALMNSREHAQCIGLGSEQSARARLLFEGAWERSKEGRAHWARSRVAVMVPAASDPEKLLGTKKSYAFRPKSAAGRSERVRQDQIARHGAYRPPVRLPACRRCRCHHAVYSLVWGACLCVSESGCRAVDRGGEARVRAGCGGRPRGRTRAARRGTLLTGGSWGDLGQG
jgi:hypothetical protein